MEDNLDIALETNLLKMIRSYLHNGISFARRA